MTYSVEFSDKKTGQLRTEAGFKTWQEALAYAKPRNGSIVKVA